MALRSPDDEPRLLPAFMPGAASRSTFVAIAILIWRGSALAEKNAVPVHVPPPLPIEAPGYSDTPRATVRDARDELPRIAGIEAPYGLRRSVAFAGLATHAAHAGASAGLVMGLSPARSWTVHAAIGREETGGLVHRLTTQRRLLGSIDADGAVAAFIEYEAHHSDASALAIGGGLSAGGKRGRHGVMGALAAHARRGDGAVSMLASGAARYAFAMNETFRIGVMGRVRWGAERDSQRAVTASGGAELMWLYGPIVIALAAGPCTTNEPAGAGSFASFTLAAVTR